MASTCLTGLTSAAAQHQEPAEQRWQSAKFVPSPVLLAGGTTVGGPMWWVNFDRAALFWTGYEPVLLGKRPTTRAGACFATPPRGAIIEGQCADRPVRLANVATLGRRILWIAARQLRQPDSPLSKGEAGRSRFSRDSLRSQPRWSTRHANGVPPSRALPCD